MSRTALVTALLSWLSVLSPAQGRWVVDVVHVGDPTSEREHEYAGEGATVGSVEGRPFRHTQGWVRYSMKVYDDSEVTVEIQTVQEHLE